MRGVKLGPVIMTSRITRLVNIALLIAVIFAFGDLVYRWNRFRLRTVYGSVPIECGDLLDEDAHYLALICQAVIKDKGSLPSNPGEAAAVIAENASRLGFTWPMIFRLTLLERFVHAPENPFRFWFCLTGSPSLLVPCMDTILLA